MVRPMVRPQSSMFPGLGTVVRPFYPLAGRKQLPPPGARSLLTPISHLLPRCSMFDVRLARLRHGLARPWHGQNLGKQALGTVSRPFSAPPEERRVFPRSIFQYFRAALSYLLL